MEVRGKLTSVPLTAATGVRIPQGTPSPRVARPIHPVATFVGDRSPAKEIKMAVFLRGSTYYLKIRCGGRQVLRSLKTSDRMAALIKAERLVEALQGGIDTASDTTFPQKPLISAPNETLGSLFAAYRERVARQVENGHLRPSYLLEIDGLWSTHLSRYAGRIIDAQLNTAVIDYLDRQNLSVSRRRKAHTLFRKLAQGVDLIIKPHRFQSAVPPKEKRPLTVAQLRAVKEACLGHTHPVAKLIYLTAVTGARIGEIMALTADDLGPDYISITKTKCRKTGKVVAAKSRNSRRVIPVSPNVLEIVQRCIGYAGKDWFPVWRAIRKRAVIGKVGIHVLRHTWATQAFAAGLPPKAVSLALGHASVSFTEAQYARFLTTGFFRAYLAAFNQ